MCFGAVPGTTTIRSPFDRPTGTGPRQSSGTTSLVFVWPRTSANPLSFILLPLSLPNVLPRRPVGRLGSLKERRRENEK